MDISKKEYEEYKLLKIIFQNIQSRRATLISTSPAEILKRIYRELDIMLEVLNESINKD